MGSRKLGRLKHKNHAQDCRTLIARMSRMQRPAILPWSLCFEWRPSFRWYGHLTRYAQLPDCCWTRRADISKPARWWTHDPDRKTGKPPFRIMRKRARKNARANFCSAANVMLFEQCLVTRLVFPLDVI